MFDNKHESWKSAKDELALIEAALHTAIQ